jgi:hypothetical protein
MGGNKAAVKECSTYDCLIYPFRLGKNPALKGKGKSPAEMAQIRALRRPFSKENPVYFERSSLVETHIGLTLKSDEISLKAQVG